MSNDLRDHVELARRRAEVREALRELYARVQAKVDERKPACETSGRCCKFEEYGHRLFVTTIELAVFVREFERQALTPSSGIPGEGRGGGSSAIDRLNERAPTLTLPRSTGGRDQREVADGNCPFQIGKLCGVHAIRPFGCRMFYCDPTAEQWQRENYEHFHAELKTLHERFEIPYRYVEWRAALVALGLDDADLSSATNGL